MEYIPTGCVALEILALPLQKTSANLLGSEMLLAGIMDLLGRAERNGRINNLVFVGDEVNPFLVLGHGNGAVAEFADKAQSIVSFALQDTSVGVVCLLDFANDNGFELAAGALEVEIGLQGLLVRKENVSWLAETDWGGLLTWCK